MRETYTKDVMQLCDVIRETGFAIHRYHRNGHLEIQIKKYILTDTNLDLGRSAKRGEYQLADKTYDEWVTRRNAQVARR